MLDYNLYSGNSHSRYPSAIAFDAVLSVKFSDEDNSEDAEPVTLDEVKDWCVIDGTDYDAKLNLLIPAAREEVESALQISLISRTVTAKIKPRTNLPFGPVIEIASITDDNENVYDALTDARCDVTVVYTAGFEIVPKKYKTKVLQQIAFMLENRGDDKAGTGAISPMIKGNNRSTNRIK